MASDVVTWLESPEGEEWGYENVDRHVPALAEIRPVGAFSTHSRRLSAGPVNPEHDPCGRPPMPP